MSFLTISIRSCLEIGSTPTEGSSSTKKSGEPIKAQARPNFCFIPPDNAPARRVLKGMSFVNSKSSSNS